MTGEPGLDSGPVCLGPLPTVSAWGVTTRPSNPAAPGTLCCLRSLCPRVMLQGIPFGALTFRVKKTRKVESGFTDRCATTSWPHPHFLLTQLLWTGGRAVVTVTL